MHFQSSTEYHGWRNWGTWVTHEWLTHDKSSHNAAREAANNGLDALRQHIEDMVYSAVCVNGYGITDASLAVDLIQAALSEIDYQGILTALTRE